jgi:hypothetical protein
LAGHLNPTNTTLQSPSSRSSQSNLPPPFWLRGADICLAVPSFVLRSTATWCCRLVSFVRVRPRIVILDLLLVASIYAQWWFVSWRLDRLRLERKRATWFQISAIVTTASGAVIALLSRGTGVLELIAIISALLAFLGWLAILVAATTSFGRAAYQRLRSA